MRRPKFRFLMAAAIVAVLLLVGSAPPASGTAATHPDLGGHLTARWWQWTLKQPATGHPFAGDNPAPCDHKQRGPIWFLGGVFNVSGEATRTCAVPRGVWLFFPVVNVDCSDLEGEPFYGATPEERRDCVELFTFSEVEVTLQREGGTALPWPAIPITSPDFDFQIPKDDVLLLTNLGRADGSAVSAGHWSLIPPLPAGQYTLFFTGTTTPPPPYDVFPFTPKITYHLTYG